MLLLMFLYLTYCDINVHKNYKTKHDAPGYVFWIMISIFCLMGTALKIYNVYFAVCIGPSDYRQVIRCYEVYNIILF